MGVDVGVDADDEIDLFGKSVGLSIVLSFSGRDVVPVRNGGSAQL